MYAITAVEHCFIISIILIVWHKTEAFYEYCNLLRVNLFKIKDYSSFVKDVPEMGYKEWLMTEHDCFFVRLITCPICLGIWLNIVFCLCIWDFSFFFVKIWISYLLYFVIAALIKKSL